MKRIFTKHSLNVFEIKLDEWTFGIHTHNFCEIILVKEGNGFHVINDSKFSFQTGDIFLLSPTDYHFLEFENPITLIYLKFTEQIFLEKSDWSKSGWSKSAISYLFSSNKIIGSIINEEKDSINIFALSSILLDEFTKPSRYSRQLVLEVFGAIIIIITKNISQYKRDDLLESKEKIERVLAYIRQNIGNENKLSLSEIAKEFNISKNYISEYLKKNTGSNFKKIVMENRLENAAILLEKSNLTITEIAERSGFYDVSHMNKSFLKYRNTNPTVFRKSKK